MIAGNVLRSIREEGQSKLSYNLHLKKLITAYQSMYSTPSEIDTKYASLLPMIQMLLCPYCTRMSFYNMVFKGCGCVQGVGDLQLPNYAENSGCCLTSLTRLPLLASDAPQFPDAVDLLLPLNY